MPFYSNTEGIQLFADDICDGCDHFMNGCNVYADLNFEGKASQYHEKHIVLPEQVEDPRTELGCQSFKPYVPPTDKPDFDPQFGERISAQEANLMDGLPQDTQRPDVR